MEKGPTRGDGVRRLIVFFLHFFFLTSSLLSHYFWIRETIYLKVKPFFTMWLDLHVTIWLHYYLCPCKFSYVHFYRNYFRIQWFVCRCKPQSRRSRWRRRTRRRRPEMTLPHSNAAGEAWSWVIGHHLSYFSSISFWIFQNKQNASPSCYSEVSVSTCRCNTWPRRGLGEGVAVKEEGLPLVCEEEGGRGEEEDDQEDREAISPHNLPLPKSNARRNPWGNFSYADLITQVVLLIRICLVFGGFRLSNSEPAQFYYVVMWSDCKVLNIRSYRSKTVRQTIFPKKKVEIDTLPVVPTGIKDIESYQEH